MKKALALFLLLQAVLLCRAHEGDGFAASDLLAGMKPGDKAALLLVHFGTTYDDTRAQTIDAVNRKAREAFPELDVREAYTSRIVIRRLRTRGVEKLTPLEALLRLRGEGYTHVVVQSTHIIEGVEMESLRKDVEAVAPFFKEIRVGTPLLYSVEDTQEVAEILAGRHAAATGNKGHVVLVGHGTYTPATAIYSQLDYMLKAAGHERFHVATIEGYPDYATVLARLKAARAKAVMLVPFMFVAGDHARNDIAGEWKEALEKEGIGVRVCTEELGEIAEVQDIFIGHIRFLLKHRMVGIMEKKARYAGESDK